MVYTKKGSVRIAIGEENVKRQSGPGKRILFSLNQRTVIKGKRKSLPRAQSADSETAKKQKDHGCLVAVPGAD